MGELSRNAVADLKLVQAIRGNEKSASEKAFTALFKKYHNSMLFHFKGMVGDEEVAKELVSEAFSKVSANIEKFNEETAVFSTWLFKLTQNLFIDRLRKKKDSIIYLSELAVYDEENHTIEYDIPSIDGTPETILVTSERDEKINAIICNMENKELSMVIKMRFFDGMSYEQISKETGKPLGTIKAFIYRAKDVLKEEFKKANISL